MRAVVYTHSDWAEVKQWIRQEFGLTATFSWNLKENFGFTVREHSEWIKKKNYTPFTAGPNASDFEKWVASTTDWRDDKIYDETIRLDFDNEDDRNMWLLRTPVPPRDF